VSFFSFGNRDRRKKARLTLLSGAALAVLPTRNRAALMKAIERSHHAETSEKRKRRGDRPGEERKEKAKAANEKKRSQEDEMTTTMTLG